MLSVEGYNQREQECADALPCRVVEMVNPITFASEGYPVRVGHERALWRYVDVMHETRFSGDFVSLHDKGLTAQEFDWLKNVASTTCDFSRKAFGRGLTSRGALLRAMSVFRSIVDVAGPAPMRVFEIGPGSGSLGCLFIQNSWGYGATDIAQAFYLLQSRLWDHVSNSRLVETASAATLWEGEIAPGQPVHFPWWEFFRFMEGRAPSVDIVTCNHALAEMHPNSLALTLHVARQMLRGNGLKLFMFEGWGFEKLNARDKVLECFLKAGFSLVHSDNTITIFAPRDNLADKQSPVLPGGQIRPHVQSAGAVNIPGNTLTPRIQAARSSRKTHLSVKLDKVDAFYRQLIGSDDLRTADERVLELIAKTY